MIKAVLPLVTLHKEKYLLCINTHIMGLLPLAVLSTLITLVLRSSIGFMLVTAINTLSMSGQLFARDFVIFSNKGGKVRTSKDNASKLEDFFIYDQPIFSILPGKVVKVVDSLPCLPFGQLPNFNSALTLAGNYIEIEHDGFYSFYAHCKQGSIKIKEGDYVEAGALIASVGNSGNSTEPHLHFSISKTRHLPVPAVGISGISLPTDIFQPFKHRDLTDGQNSLMFDANAIFKSKILEERLADFSKVKETKTNELPHFGIIGNQ
jgi:hypothetical protein